KDFTPEMLHRLAKNDYDWHPERSPEGPITIVISSADKAMYVYRNGEPIGRASIEVSGKGLSDREKLGNHVFTMLEGQTGKQSGSRRKREEGRWRPWPGKARPVDPGRLARNWGFGRDLPEKPPVN